MTKKQVKNLVKSARPYVKIIGCEIYANKSQANVYIKESDCMFTQLVITEREIDNASYYNGLREIKINYLLFGMNKWYTSTLTITEDEYNNIVQGAN